MGGGEGRSIEILPVVLLVETIEQVRVASWPFLCRCCSVPRCSQRWKVGGDWRGVLSQGEQEQQEEGGWTGGKSRKVWHKHPGNCVKGGGGKRSLRRHLSLMHRGERHNLQGRSEDA